MKSSSGHYLRIGGQNLTGELYVWTVCLYHCICLIVCEHDALLAAVSHYFISVLIIYIASLQSHVIEYSMHR